MDFPIHFYMSYQFKLYIDYMACYSAIKFKPILNFHENSSNFPKNLKAQKLYNVFVHKRFLLPFEVNYATSSTIHVSLKINVKGNS